MFVSVASAQLYLHSSSMPDSPLHRHRHQSHQRRVASNSTNVQNNNINGHTNSTLGNYNMTNTTTNTGSTTSSQPLDNTTTSNYTFCQAPKDDDNHTAPYPNSCKAQSQTWKLLSDQSTSTTTIDMNTEWTNANNDTTCRTNRFPNDYLSGECGPQCRPSCITLQLSLKKLQQNYNDVILCSNDKSTQNTSDCFDNHYSQKNKCAYTKRQPQPICDAATTLYEQYPSCYLEDAKCFGPTLYDDIVALYESRWNNTTATTTRIPSMEHCTAIPRENPLQERFHGWPIVTPRQVHCDDDNSTSPCFNSSTGSSDNDMLYFEYCNILEEDYDSCDACITGTSSSPSGAKEACRNECSKVIQPFPSGWTTFVVSASIPYKNIDHTMHDASVCDQDIQYANETGAVCFLQRIEVYYPEDCPYCHGCPHNVGLGDMFGPLEVIGFGHVATNSENLQQPQQGCAPCNKASRIRNSETTSLSCLQLQQCHESVDCSTGTTLGIPSYTSNQCSFQNPSIEDDDLVQEDSTPSDDDGLLDDDVPNPDRGSDDRVPTNTPATRKPSKKVTAIPTNAPSTSYSPTFDGVSVTTNPTTTANRTITTPTERTTNDPSPTMAIDRPSKEFRFSPFIATFIVIALIIVISIQLIIYRKRTVGAVQQQQQQKNKNSEEILYIEEPLEFDGIDKILSKKEHNSDDNGSQQTVTENDNDDNLSQEIEVKRGHLGRWRSFRGPTTSPHRSVSNICVPSSQLEIRHFQTASIVERSDQNEIEALYMTGQHHVLQSPSSPKS